MWEATLAPSSHPSMRVLTDDGVEGFSGVPVVMCDSLADLWWM